MIERNVDVAIIGGGPSGLAAAIAAKRSGSQNVLILERNNFLGGILIQCIHPGFGMHLYQEELTGPEFAARLIADAAKEGVEYLLKAMVVDLNDQKELIVDSPQGLIKIKAKAVILAMGCRERTRGMIGIPGFRPAGVFSAGTAQNYINMQNLQIGREAIILGSGDIGLIMARHLTLEGIHVIGVHEVLPYCSGSIRNRVQCLEDFGIPLHLSSTVTDIHGKHRLEAVTVAKVDGKLQPIAGTEQKIACDTLLLSVGLIPENELARKAGVKLSVQSKGAEVDDHLETSVPGIFSCGNVLHIHDMADYASNEGLTAGQKASEYASHKTQKVQNFSVHSGEGIATVIPQFVRQDTREVEIKFRIRKPMYDVQLQITNRGQPIHTRRFQTLLHSEMQLVKLKSTEPLDDLKIEIVPISQPNAR